MSSKKKKIQSIKDGEYYPDGFWNRNEDDPSISYPMLDREVWIGSDFAPFYEHDDAKMTAWKLVDMHDGTTDWAYKKVYHGSYYRSEEHPKDEYEYGGAKQAFQLYDDYIFIGYCADTEEILMLSGGLIYRLPKEYAGSFYSARKGSKFA